MHLAGYQFQVLSPVFNCHWGLQVRKGRPSWREAQNNRNRRNFDGFKREIYARYNKPLPTKKPPKQQPQPVAAVAASHQKDKRDRPQPDDDNKQTETKKKEAIGRIALF